MAFIPIEVVLIQDAFSSLNTVQDIKEGEEEELMTLSISLKEYYLLAISFFSLQQKFGWREKNKAITKARGCSKVNLMATNNLF